MSSAASPSPRAERPEPRAENCPAPIGAGHTPPVPVVFPSDQTASHLHWARPRKVELEACARLDHPRQSRALQHPGLGCGLSSHVNELRSHRGAARRRPGGEGIDLLDLVARSRADAVMRRAAAGALLRHPRLPGPRTLGRLPRTPSTEYGYTGSSTGASTRSRSTSSATSSRRSFQSGDELGPVGLEAGSKPRVSSIALALLDARGRP